MGEQSRPAPRWRGRTKCTGPIVGPYDTPKWILALERWMPAIIAALAAVALAVCALAYGLDALAGHL